jgi:hypothetical protein
LRKLLRTPNLENDIHARVSLFTKCSFQASRFLQLHLQRVIENDLPFPDILNATWIRSVYSIVTNRQRFSVESDPDLVTTYDNYFQQPTAEYRLSPITGSSQMLTYFTQDYTRNLKLYIKTHFESMCKRWVEHCLKLRGLPLTAARNMARLVWEYATEDEDDDQGDDALDMPISTTDNSTGTAPIPTADDSSATVPTATADDSSATAPTAIDDDSSATAPTATADDSSATAPTATTDDSSAIAFTATSPTSTTAATLKHKPLLLYSKKT